MNEPNAHSRHLRIGIYGGTFDPIHLGHIYCAVEASKKFDLDKVLFIPAAISPFKQERKVADISDRITMCELAVEPYQDFAVCDIEATREGVSFTVDTIIELHEGEYRGSKLFFIIGSDAFLGLPDWKRADELVELVDFVVVMRSEDTESDVRAIADAMGAKVHILDDERVNASSTDIRDALRDGRDLSGLLPEEVAVYIKEKGLYRE